MNMKQWLSALPASGLAMPLLSFPAAQFCGATVYQFTHSAALQAEGIYHAAKRMSAAAAVCMMDLSVEAEAFGCTVKAEEHEVPTVTGILLSDEDDAQALAVPKVGTARTGLYIDAARMAKERISADPALASRPVLAGIIGPFSLAGRLMDVSEALVNCIADGDFVHATLKKTTAFLIEYAKTYKAAGVDGIVMAEPLAGLLSPALEAEFSAPYVREIIDAVKNDGSTAKLDGGAVQDDSFIVIYHNCGPNTPYMTASLSENHADAYHFGDAVSLCDLLAKLPSDKPVMGNISPTEQFLGGTPDTVRRAVKELRAACAAYPNFVLSSGCDIPPAAKWENIDAFFEG